MYWCLAKNNLALFSLPSPSHSLLVSLDDSHTLVAAIAADFKRVAHLLQEASYEIRCRGMAEHPLFVRCVEVPQLGTCLVARGEHQAEAHYHASSLNELAGMGMVAEKESFLRTYKDSDTHACLFVVEPKETFFLYLPYPPQT